MKNGITVMFKHRIALVLKDGPTDRLMAMGVLGATIFSLTFAYTAQYGFGLQPCVLCLYQRPPYFIAAALAGLVWMLTRRGDKFVSGRRALLWACVALFAIESGIAFFQVGVEHHWWRGFTGCSGPDPARMSADEYLAALAATAHVVRCDVVQFSILGVSMAGMNALWAEFLGIALALGLIKTHTPRGV